MTPTTFTVFACLAAICGPMEVHVVDGDTARVGATTYRLEDIDTPERGHRAKCVQEALQATAATNRLAELLSTHQFTIVPNGRDRYGRTLALFMIGEESVGEMMVREGFARKWRGRREGWC